MANKDFKVKNGIDVQTPIPVSMGGTGQTSSENTLNALLPVQTGNANKVLQTDGTNTTWVTLPNGYQKGGTAGRPASPSSGDIYSNTDTGYIEVYTASGWSQLGVIPTSAVIGTATNVGTNRAYNNGAASVTFTPGAGGGLVTSYTATSTSGGYSATGQSSPIVVQGLQSNTSYQFTVTATNGYGNALASDASNSATITTVPQAPTIGTATAGDAQASVTFTAGATGGSTITSYTVISSPGNITASGSSSPITITGLTNDTSYTFTVTATNANGTSLSSSASNSTTPTRPYFLASATVLSGGYQILQDSSKNMYVNLYGSNYKSGPRKIAFDASISLQRETSYESYSTNSYGNGIALDSSNNIYTTSSYPYNGFAQMSALTKYDSSGSILWSRRMFRDPGGQNVYFTHGDIAIDSEGSPCLGGSIYISGPYSAGHFLKYNSSGTIQWTKQYEGPSGVSRQASVQSVAVDSSNNVYVGMYAGDGYNSKLNLIKYNSSGNEQWSKGISASRSGYSMGYGGLTAVDSSNNAYLLGYIPNATTSGYYLVLAKYNSSGTRQWCKYIASSSTSSSQYSTPEGIDIDGSGNVYIVGRYNRVVGPPVVESGFIVKLDSSGNILWQRYIQGDYATGGDYVYAISAKGASDGFVIRVQGKNASDVSFDFIGRLPSDGSGTGTYTISSGKIVTYGTAAMVSGDLTPSESGHNASVSTVGYTLDSITPTDSAGTLSLTKVGVA